MVLPGFLIFENKEFFTPRVRFKYSNIGGVHFGTLKMVTRVARVSEDVNFHYSKSVTSSTTWVPLKVDSQLQRVSTAKSMK